MTTLTITDFIVARIGDDRDAAQDCGMNSWVARFREGLATVELAPTSPYHRIVVSEIRPRSSHSTGVVRGYQAHIARHDPVRAIAECDAKQAIVERHSHCDDVSYGDASTCPDMCALAGIWSDHEDFQAGWAS